MECVTFMRQLPATCDDGVHTLQGNTTACRQLHSAQGQRMRGMLGWGSTSDARLPSLVPPCVRAPYVRLALCTPALACSRGRRPGPTRALPAHFC